MVFPYFKKSLNKIELILGLKNKYVYNSPEIEDPDSILIGVDLTLTPKLNCRCLRARFVNNHFRIIIDQSRLSEKDIGIYQLSAEIKTLNFNPIVKTKPDVLNI